MKHTFLSVIVLSIALGISLNAECQTLKYAITTPPDTLMDRYSTESISITPDGNIVTAGSCDGGMWISKHDPNGISLWSITVPLLPYYFPVDMATDKIGNIYVCGSTDRSFDANPSTDTATIRSHIDASGYVLKYDKDGKYIWGFSIVNKHNWIKNIAVDKDNNCYVSGEIKNSDETIDLDPSDSNAFVKGGYASTPFIAKYDENGKYVWGAAYRGHFEIGNIAVDSINQLLVAGVIPYYNSVDVDNGPDSVVIFDTTSNRTFIARYQSDGSYLNSMHIGDLNKGPYVTPTSIAVDYNNNIIMTGRAVGKDIDFDPSLNQYIVGGDYFPKIFVSKYTSQFDFQWVFELQAFGQWCSDSATYVSLDTKGNICLTARIGSDTIDIDPGSNSTLFLANDAARRNYADIFLGMYSPDGEFRWGQVCNSSGVDWATCSVPDNNGSIYFAGMVEGDTVDFDPSPATVFLSSSKSRSNPKQNISSPFIAKYSVPTNAVKNITGISSDDLSARFINDKLHIGFTSNSHDDIIINVYDALGKNILSDMYHPTSLGTQDVVLPFANQASGLYVCEVKIGNIRRVAKLMVIK